MEVKKSKKKWIIILVAVLILALVGGIGGYFLHKSLNQKQYKKQSELGDKYYASMQYNLAVIAYQEAIEAQPEEPEAYKSLAKIYIEQENYTEAKSLLRKGLAKTHDVEFNTLIDQVNSLQYGITEDDLTVQALEEKSRDVKPKTDVFTVVANATHQTLMDKYKNCSAQKLSSGEWSVNYDGLDAAVYYKDDGKSKDAPADGQQPSRVQFATIGAMFDGFQGLISYVKLNELFGSGVNLKYDDLLQKNVVTFYYKDCRIAMECDTEGNVLSSSASNYIASTILVESDDTSNISGKVRDYNTMNGVKANITFTCTDRDTELEPVTIASATSGKYQVDLPVGNYEVKVEAEGYEDGNFTLEIPEVKNQTNIFYDIVPKQAEAIGTITLSWEGDADLDLYVHTTYGTVYYGQKEVTGDNREMIAKLDRDSKDGSQKETITIYDINSSYSICVQEYNHTLPLRDTKAVLTIEMFQKGTKTLKVPTNGTESHWCASTISRGEVSGYEGGLSDFDEEEQVWYKAK